MNALIPITRLEPGMTKSAYIHGVVTLIWPYSSSQKVFSLLLVEPDIRLRRNRGQVRINFRGSCAKSLARAGIVSGHELQIQLAGSKWLQEDPSSNTVRTPGRTIGWELLFDSQLHLKIFQDDGVSRAVDVESSAGSPQVESASEHSVPHTPIQASVSASPSRSFEPSNSWSTPVILKKRTLVQALAPSSYDIFTDESIVSHEPLIKRVKFGRGSQQWRFVDDTSSDEQDSISSNIASSRLLQALQPDSEPKVVNQTTHRDDLNPPQYLDPIDTSNDLGEGLMPEFAMPQSPQETSNANDGLGETYPTTTNMHVRHSHKVATSDEEQQAYLQTQGDAVVIPEEHESMVPIEHFPGLGAKEGVLSEVTVPETSTRPSIMPSTWLSIADMQSVVETDPNEAQPASANDTFGSVSKDEDIQSGSNSFAVHQDEVMIDARQLVDFPVEEDHELGQEEESQGYDVKEIKEHSELISASDTDDEIDPFLAMPLSQVGSDLALSSRHSVPKVSEPTDVIELSSEGDSSDSETSKPYHINTVTEKPPETGHYFMAEEDDNAAREEGDDVHEEDDDETREEEEEGEYKQEKEEEGEDDDVREEHDEEQSIDIVQAPQSVNLVESLTDDNPGRSLLITDSIGQDIVTEASHAASQDGVYGFLTTLDHSLSSAIRQTSLTITADETNTDDEQLVETVETLAESDDGSTAYMYDEPSQLTQTPTHMQKEDFSPREVEEISLIPERGVRTPTPTGGDGENVVTMDQYRVKEEESPRMHDVTDQSEREIIQATFRASSPPVHKTTDEAQDESNSPSPPLSPKPEIANKVEVLLPENSREGLEATDGSMKHAKVATGSKVDQSGSRSNDEQQDEEEEEEEETAQAHQAHPAPIPESLESSLEPTPRRSTRQTRYLSPKLGHVVSTNEHSPSAKQRPSLRQKSRRSGISVRKGLHKDNVSPSVDKAEVSSEPEETQTQTGSQSPKQHMQLRWSIRNPERITQKNDHTGKTRLFEGSGGQLDGTDASAEFLKDRFVGRPKGKTPVILSQPRETPEQQISDESDRSFDPASQQLLQEAQAAQDEEETAPLSMGVRTQHAYLSPLSNLTQHYRKTVDTMGLVVGISKPERARTGPRDWHLTLYVTDGSMPDVPQPLRTVQIFRPSKYALPLSAAADDVVLLHEFRSESQKRKPVLVSTSGSGWAVFGGEGKVKTSGSLIEFGEEEIGLSKQLHSWWSSTPDERKMQLRTNFMQARDAAKEAARRKSGRKSIIKPGAMAHELRDGTVYPYTDTPLVSDE